MTPLRFLTVLMLVLALAGPASAVQIMYEFSLTPNDTDAGIYLGASVIDGFYIYESTTPGLVGPPGEANYAGGLIDLQFSVDGNPVNIGTIVSDTLKIRNGPVFLMGEDTVGLAVTTSTLTFQLLGIFGENEYASTDIPTSLTGSVFGDFSIVGPGSNDFAAGTFGVLSYTGAPVPEPTTATLIAVGLAIASWRMRRGGHKRLD